jgi:hypothetical protein
MVLSTASLPVRAPRVSSCDAFPFLFLLYHNSLFLANSMPPPPHAPSHFTGKYSGKWAQVLRVIWREEGVRGMYDILLLWSMLLLHYIFVTT